MSISGFKKVFIFALLVFCIFPGCSGGGKTPVQPVLDSGDGIPIATAQITSTRTVLAVYDATIDPVAKTFTVTPSKDRLADYHFPLTQLFPNVLKITAYGWTPNFWADIKLTHPFPGSGIDAFDPRVIAILPANPGVSMNYPIFNVVANDSVVLNLDGYTKLFDSLGGGIPGNTNPFKAYFKDQPNRVWSSTGVTSETQRWNLNLAGFGGPMIYKFVVDISTNYPTPSQPIIDNAPEPVEISAIIGGGLTQNGGSALIEVTFLDWQGASDIKCKVECPELFNSAIQLSYSRAGPNPNEYIFSGNILNDLLAPQGEYHLLIAAWDIPTDIHVFDETNAVVDFEQTFNPVDVTPSSLNFGPQDMCLNGNYLYIASYAGWLHIFDNSNPINPVWVNSVATGMETYDVDVSNGYAYVVNWSEFHIVDIDPPTSAHIVKSFSMFNAYGVSVSNGYAFVICSSSFYVINIDPPETAYIFKSFDSGGFSVQASDGYACVTGFGFDSNDQFIAYLVIYDIDPIDSMKRMEIYNNFDVPFDSYISDGYLYITSDIFQIRELIPPDFNLVKSVGMSGTAYDLSVSDGYAYVLTNKYNADLQIIDVDPPSSAYLVASLDTPRSMDKVAVSDGYAYLGDTNSGFYIVDVDPPDSASVEKTVYTPSFPYDITLDGNCAYLMVRSQGMQIVNIENPSLAYAVNGVDITGSNSEVFASGGYAFVTGYYAGIKIIDVDPPETAQIVKTVGTSLANDVFVSDGYAYVAAKNLGLQIIDIDPVDSAQIVKTVESPTTPLSVFVSNGYAFVGLFRSLLIIDIEPYDSAHIEKTVDNQLWNSHVFVSDNYVYLTNDSHKFQIIGIDPIDSAHIVKTIDMPDNANGITISQDYAYVAVSPYVSDSTYLQIIDIFPPDAAHIEKTVYIPGYAHDVSVSGNYAYVADCEGGMRIIKLW